VLVFKHEAVLTFVGRLLRDREFAEWFAARPDEALASHGLELQDLRQVADLVQSDRYRPELSRALQPTVQLLVGIVEAADGAESDLVAAARWQRLDDELRLARDRVAQARRQSARPWWKFW
jgi:hypothetical protein